MVVNIETRTVGSPNPAEDVNLIVAELNRVARKADQVFDVTSYGAQGDGVLDCAAAINAAITAATDAGGGVVTFPIGRYRTSGGHVLPANVHLRGSSPIQRYYGLSSAMPTESCAIFMSASANTWMFRASPTMRGASITNIALLGNNVTATGSAPVHCLDWTAGPNEQSFLLANVSIVGFSGDGIRGRLSVFRAHNVMIGGNRGWGAQTLTSFWTDTRFTDVFFNGNLLGGMLIDGTNQSGLCEFNGIRFERSGWDPATNTLAAGATAGAPGIRIGNAKDLIFTSCTTDANSGNGLHLSRPSNTKNVFRLFFMGCVFNRDGWGAGTDSPVVDQDYSSVRIEGSPGASIDNITFVGCATGFGKPIDGAGGTVLYPQHSVTWAYATFPLWIGGKVQAAVAAAAWDDRYWTTNFQPVRLLTQTALTLPAFATGLIPQSLPTPLTDGDFFWDSVAKQPTFTDGTSLYGVPRTWNVRSFGARGNGTQDDTAAIQACLTAATAAAGSGAAIVEVVFPPGRYQCSGLTVAGKVHLIGHGASLRANAAGPVMTVTGQHARLSNLQFEGVQGQGSSGLVFATGSKWGKVDMCRFLVFDGRALHIQAGAISIEVTTVYADSCLLASDGLSTYTGVVEISGANCSLHDSEIAGARASLSTGGWVTAVAVTGSSNYLGRVTAEAADLGFYLAGFHLEISDCRAESNWGHGWVVANCTGSVKGGYALNNGRAGDNTYDGFRATAGQMTFSSCAAFSSTSPRHRYGFGDTQSNVTDQNWYVSVRSYNAATSAISVAATNGAKVLNPT